MALIVKVVEPMEELGAPKFIQFAIAAWAGTMFTTVNTEDKSSRGRNRTSKALPNLLDHRTLLIIEQA